ncbi:MAG: hypothetical protein HZA19_00500 [Nitrospirae bacterium]|nr:hypothetical protein [Nitrospirota bacterium]
MAKIRMDFKKIITLSFVLISFMTVSAEAWTGNANILAGGRAMGEDDWSPAENQDLFGIQLNFRRSSWPVNLSLEYLKATAKGNMSVRIPGTLHAESDVQEIRLGVRKIWDHFRSVRPYIGGGVSFIDIKFDTTAVQTGPTTHLSDSDTAFGPWIGGGVYWLLGNSINMGFDISASRGSVSIDRAAPLEPIEASAGGGTSSFLLGYHW